MWPEWTTEDFAAIGITWTEAMHSPCWSGGFIKFMGYGDICVEQGDQFEAWLKANNFLYARLGSEMDAPWDAQRRKFYLGKDAVKRMREGTLRGNPTEEELQELEEENGNGYDKLELDEYKKEADEESALERANEVILEEGD